MSESVWHELLVTDVPRAQAGRLGAALISAGASGVQEDCAPGTAPPPQQPWDSGPAPAGPPTVWLRAWFEQADTTSLPACLGVFAATASWSVLPDVDWATSWQDKHPAIQVGSLRVAPPWLAEPGDLILDPGEGFGTGQHPTTAALMGWLQQGWSEGGPYAPSSRQPVFDIGTGSGILLLLAHRLGLGPLWGIDVDEAALANARHNAALNDMPCGPDLRFDSTALDQLPGKAPLVLANLYAELLVELAVPLAARCSDHLLLAGILTDRAHRVRQCFEGDGPAGGFDCVACVTAGDKGEWTALHYRRRVDG